MLGKTTDSVLTAPELVRIVRVLDGRLAVGFTERRLRSLDVRQALVERAQIEQRNWLGEDEEGSEPVVASSSLLGRHQPRSRGDSRLYGPEDIVLVRVALRLRAYLPLWVVRSILSFLAEELRSALYASSDLVLVADGASARLVTTRIAAALPSVVIAVPMSEVTRGVVEAVKRHRRAQPEIWIGHRSRNAGELRM